MTSTNLAKYWICLHRGVERIPDRVARGQLCGGLSFQDGACAHRPRLVRRGGSPPKRSDPPFSVNVATKGPAGPRYSVNVAIGRRRIPRSVRTRLPRGRVDGAGRPRQRGGRNHRVLGERGYGERAAARAGRPVPRAASGCGDAEVELALGAVHAVDADVDAGAEGEGALLLAAHQRGPASGDTVEVVGERGHVDEAVGL